MLSSSLRSCSAGHAAVLGGWGGLRAAIIAALLLWLGGCSSLRMTYDQGPTLAYWWLDRYADFEGEQVPRTRDALAAWFAWHRRTQLPGYLPALAALRQDAAGNLSAEQVCRVERQWQQRALDAYDHALPALAEAVLTLSPRQIDHIAQRLAKNLDDDRRERLAPPPDERRAANFKRALERAQDFYGRLDEAQRALLAEALAASPFDPARWLAERQARHADLLRRLRGWRAQDADAASVQDGLRALAREALLSPRADYRALAEQVERARCTLVAQLHNATHAEQRRRAAERIQGWEDDLRALARADQ